MDSESRLLNLNIKAALNERLIAVVLSEGDRPPITLRLGSVATQTEGSLHAQKRAIIALYDAPDEILESVTRVEGGFLSGVVNAIDQCRSVSGHGLNIVGSSILLRLLE